MKPLPHIDFPPIDFIEIAEEIGFGFFVMSVVFIYLGYFITWISASHSVKSQFYINNSRYFMACFEFINKMAILALVQIGAIVIWGVSLFLAGLADNISQAFLFAGSCYTTIGIFADVLPPGWKALALIMAFSGLFSFAWSTSIMISMTSIFQQAWKNKHAKTIEKNLNSDNV